MTEQDIQMLLDRRGTVERFDRLLNDPEFFELEKNRLNATEEKVWQLFFEENTWIFGYGLTLLACREVQR